jgi:hypothetical protein
MYGGIHWGYLRNTFPPAAAKPATESLNSELIGLFSAGCLIFYVAQELHNSFASDITGNDSDARVKNAPGSKTNGI